MAIADKPLPSPVKPRPSVEVAASDTLAPANALERADIAQSKLATAGKDTDFYTGKIASAKFFVRSVLPHISVERAVVESETGEIMDIAEAAF